MKWRYLLMPFALLYGGIASIRRRFYERQPHHAFQAQIATICVGNLSVGGTGKTPHCALIAKILSRHFHTALLSRGYGRKTRGFILADTYPSEQLTADTIGDEPLLLHRRFPHIPLAVDANRKEGILKIQEHYPDTETIILDDALQHLAVVPSCRILLTEYSHPYSDDWPMPAGNLREFKRAAHVADIVIVTKTNALKENIQKSLWRSKLQLDSRQHLFFTRYTYDLPQPVTLAAQNITLDIQTPIILLTGIAHPEPLLHHLQKSFSMIRHLRYPDHHHYSIRETIHIRKKYFLEKSTKNVLFTTEKDWMRLQAEKLKKIVSLLPIFVLPVQVDFVFEEDEKLFTHIIENHVRRKAKKN